MNIKETAWNHGTISYEELEDGTAAILGYRGTDGTLNLPEQIDGRTVTAIGKKAFLSMRGITGIKLPQTVTHVDDWAFAHCTDLEEVTLPMGKLELGKALFMECDKLKSITLLPKDGKPAEGYGTLLAATTSILDAAYLFQTETIDDPEWLSMWDARMLSILHTDDMEGYTNLLLCGEEDYGSDETDLEHFLSEKRKRKVRLAFLRLLYDKGLTPQNREELTDYLLAHTKGCESEETYLVVRNEYGEDQKYFELFSGLGCLTEDNLDAILLDLSEEHPQMKAYFMKYKEEKMGYEDFFEGLSLDL